MNKRIHCMALCIAVFLLLLIPKFANAQSPVRTIIGADRIETAILVSQEAYECADTVFLAPHTAFPDALAGISLAKKNEAPILLNPDPALPPEVLQEIGRRGAQKVLLLGGRFQPDVTETLLAQGLSVQTVSGSDRYETSRFVTSAAFSPEEITKAILVSGEDFADAVSGSALAYRENLPILLVNRADRGLAEIRATGAVFADLVAAVSLVKDGSGIRLLRGGLSELGTEQCITIVGGRIQNDLRRLAYPNVLWVNPHQDDETINGLTLIRDVQAGKNVYFMQVTKGDATSALARVNAKLKKNGYPIELNRNELSDARDREVLEAMTAIGMPAAHFIDLNYHQFEATPAQVEKATGRFVDEQALEGGLEIKTLAAPEAWEYSARRKDHRIVREGVRRFHRANPDVCCRYYLHHKEGMDYGKNLDCAVYHRLEPADPGEYAMWQRMYDAYEVWDPDNGRFAVGATSLGKNLQAYRENRVLYMTESPES
ncbi:MAG: cell wall-binding repeat-containing protein [Christensenellales bacterium]|nr:cell wall-binding repeat-containing protein [Bacillota bacterium]